MSVGKPKVSTDDCWLWGRQIDSKGYGQLTNSGIRYSAHRFMYLAYRGDIPTGLEVDHICDTPRCMNPDHLQLLTHAENTRKRFKPNHCNYGHELTPDNCYIQIKNKKTGRVGRSCKICSSRRSHAAYIARGDK